MNYYDTHERFIQTYGETYLNKIEHLRQRVVEWETGENKFVVLPFEAGIGKSLQTDRIIGEYLAQHDVEDTEQVFLPQSNRFRGFLIVKPFVEDVLASVERINQHCDSNVALGITGENWGQYKDDADTLAFFPVVVITHERYLRLMRDEYTRKFFAENRHTLIIDEAVQMPTYSFSEVDYRKMQQHLPRTLHSSLEKVCSGLFKEIDKLDNVKLGNRMVKCNPRTRTESLRQFKANVEAQSFQLKDLNDVRKFLEALDVLYSNSCLYNNGRLTSFDSELQRWGLRNNIILDANGSIDRQYSYDENITIDSQTPIITHENWTLHQIPFNSSKSHIKKTDDYFEQVCKNVIERKRESDKTLIVTQKEFRDKLEACLVQSDVQDISVAHFGDIIGKNDWRDYTQVWVTANPLIPMEIYPLKWAIATRQKITGHFTYEMLTAKDRKGKFTFKNKDFEEIRFGYVVSELYQAIKRINRDNTKKAEVFVVNADGDVINELQKHLKGIQTGEVIELDVQYRQKPKKTSKKSQVDRCVDYLIGLPTGTYDKSEVRQVVGGLVRFFMFTLKTSPLLKLLKSWGGRKAAYG